MIGTRIEAIMKLLGKNKTGFAALFDVTPTTVSHWISGRNEPDIATLLKLAELGNTTLDWLLTGTESTFKPPLTTLDDPKNIKRAEGAFFPVVAKVTAGDFQIFENIIGEVFIPLTITKHRFAVMVDGDSMRGGARPIEHGDYVLVDELQSALEGDVVVVLAQDRMLVKQYAGRQDGKIELRSYNPAYPPMHLPVDEVEKVLRVIYHQPKGWTL